ncbi:efflux RND transporter periplasmic adaptor subunit [Brevibacillus migulae]|uniref:efflux RND transporter periplasmic adaptor subunit n=1 Tax=Brevibacillus migulae TaxID=1644114 RepID=UPI00106DE1A4|nr:efflux RND transporter periplasmic adaptor subunit [Brevibacillus migulae]
MQRWVVLALVALLMTSGCEKIEREVDQLRDQDEETVLKVKYVNAFTVADQQEGLTQEVSGVVAPRKEISLSFGTSGKINKIYAQKGSVVQAGALLATLDTSVWQQQISAAQGQVASANIRREKTAQGADRHDLEQQKLQVEKARENASRAAEEWRQGKILYDNGAISKEEMDNLTLKDKQAKISLQEQELRYKDLQEGADRLDLEAANVAVEQARAELARAQQDASEAMLKAPFTGVIAEIAQIESEQTGPGTEVIRMVDISQWLVRLQIESDQIGNWQLGKKVTLTAADGSQAEGRVSFVAPVLDEQTGTYPVEVTVQGAMDTWKGGMTVKCQYEVKPRSGLLVPVSAVGVAAESYYVMKIDNEVVKKEPVKVGALYGQYYEILEGLNEGDQIVSTGISYVVDGEVVKVANEE